MIELSRGIHELHHRVHLNAGFRSDLRWWACVLPVWNGSCPLSYMATGAPQVQLMSDASGSWGCGAYISHGQWFQMQLPESWLDVHITIKELLPIILVVAVWGGRWQGLSASCRCDNAAVVSIVNSGRSKVDRAMHLMRCLSFFLAGTCHWCTGTSLGHKMMLLMPFHEMLHLPFSGWCQGQVQHQRTCQTICCGAWYRGPRTGPMSIG